MLLLLKIPVIYLCAVVWWAVRAQPRPADGAAVAVSLERPPACGWRRRTHRPRGGNPRRRPSSPVRPIAYARAGGRR